MTMPLKSDATRWGTLAKAFHWTIVALLFSAQRPRAAYLRSKMWVDRAAGAVMGALGIKLIYDAGRPA